MGVTGGIGIDLKNWVKKIDAEGNTILDEDGEPELEQVFSIDTGTVLTINTKTKSSTMKMALRALRYRFGAHSAKLNLFVPKVHTQSFLVKSFKQLRRYLGY